MSLNQSSSNLSSTDVVEKQKKQDSYPDEQENYHLQSNSDPSIGIKTVLPTYPKQWFKMKHIQRLMWVIFIISLTSCNTGYDGSLLNSLYTEKDFNNAIGNVSGSILGALTNGYVFGCLISFLFSARMNDKLGRKKCLIYCNIIMIIGVLLQSVAGAWKHDGYPEHYTKRDVLGMMIAGRIVIGIGSGVIQLSAPSLIAEVAYPDPTARSIQINYYNSNWYLGAIVAAWVSFGVKKVHHHWSWRIPTIIQCLFATLQLILVPFFVPESPRWFVSQGRFEEAREVLNDLHAGHLEIGQELIEYEMNEIQLAIEQEKAAAKTSYKDLFKTKSNLKRMWIICWVAIFMQLSGNGLVSYYLGKVLNSIGYTSTSEQLIINAGLMIYNLGVCVIQSFWIVPAVKKRVILMKASVGGMLVSFIIWTILSAKAQQNDFKDKSMGKAVLAFIFIYYFFYNLGLNGLPFTYCTEILPYTTRAKGLSVFTAVQFVVQIYNGFVNPIAMDAIHWKYYIVYVCILAVEFCVCFTFIETSGRTLEEVADVFGDGIADLGAVSGIAALTDGKAKKNAEDTEFIE
ncbi:related to hexose transporter protein [Hanseniaspora guilliermondii]|uniref:Related to hexose transporter protein n=1 Tax=Hanseniaspora guilliermondii TaxID=56406 RepID=A0A1L0CLZ6_9ASCO|nr:related to hexose transporter protein [Hanseniaspora guilliermondii]